MSGVAALVSTDASLNGLLVQARRVRRISQVELALRLGVSQRHVSFVETGRAKPSRDLLMHWLEVLGAAPAHCNTVMLSAGYAPLYGMADSSDPTMQSAQHAIARLLQQHDPFPALVLDTHWNVLKLNRGARFLAGLLMPGWLANHAPGKLNLLDALASPDGPNRCLLNLPEIAPSLIAQLQHEAQANPSLHTRVLRVIAQIESRLGPRRCRVASLSGPSPVLRYRYATDFGELCFFSMFTTFGSPQDITLASLRIEHMFPLDDPTEQVLRACVIQESGEAAPTA